MKWKRKSREIFGAKDLIDVVFESPKPKGQRTATLLRLAKIGCHPRNADLRVSEGKVVSIKTQKGRLLWQPILLGDYK